MKLTSVELEVINFLNKELEKEISMCKRKSSSRDSRKSRTLPAPLSDINRCNFLGMSATPEEIEECLLFQSKRVETPNIPLSDCNVRLLLDKIKYLSRGNNGIAFTTTSKTGKKIVVKYEDYPNQDLHEAFVGLSCLNDLRKKIPNFVYTYGFAECSAPSGDGDKQEWCLLPTHKEEVEERGSKGRKFFFYEYVPGDTLDIFVLKKFPLITISERINIILSLVLSLIVANDEKDFTHYDLGPRNIIVYEANEIVKINYSSSSFPEGGIDLYTSFIPKAIDFSFSHVKKNGVDYGIKRSKYFIYNFSNIFTDIFKVLKGILEKCYSLCKYGDNPSLEITCQYLFNLLSLIIPFHEKTLSLINNDDIPFVEKREAYSSFFKFSSKVSNLPISFTRGIDKKFFISIIKDNYVLLSSLREGWVDYNTFEQKREISLPFEIKSLELEIIAEKMKNPLTKVVDVDALLSDKMRLLSVLVGKIEQFQIWNQPNEENQNSFFVGENIVDLEETAGFVIESALTIGVCLSFTDLTHPLLFGLIERYNSSTLFVERFRKILKEVVSSKTKERHFVFFDAVFKYF